MSYLDYPRLHFSGGFKASPSTINNSPNNYSTTPNDVSPVFYPSPNELENVELYWNPKGDGGFGLVNCVVTRVEYAQGEFATTPEEDAIIGQPVTSLRHGTFPVDSAMVDLDPMQQNTSEIYAMRLQIGDDSANLTGSFPNTAFNAIWFQAKDGPGSSASGSAVFQANLNGLTPSGAATGSRFLQYFSDNPTATLSVNFNTYCHNNAPHSYAFTEATFKTLAKNGVAASTLLKLAPMKGMFQNATENPDQTLTPKNPGYIPTKEFATYMMQQYLSVEEYNDCIDTVLEYTATPYTGATTEDFLFGLATGTAGPAAQDSPTYFVQSRMMTPSNPNPMAAAAYFAPFYIDSDNYITINLGNSLPTSQPGSTPDSGRLGILELVAFPPATVGEDQPTSILQIDYSESLITQQAGFFRAKLNEDYSNVPLGITSTVAGGAPTVLLAENPSGYNMRADQFVFRMNPGATTTPSYPRGETATAKIYVTKFGQPAPDGTEVFMQMMTQAEALSYTKNTLGTSGTNGIKNISVPQDALKMAGGALVDGHWRATATTVNGVASFDLSCVDPNNPRVYVDGQIYFLQYGFADATIQGTFKQDPDDIVSVQVYNQNTDPAAPDVLKKFGMLYKIMGFLTNEQGVEQIDMRNMIKLLLQRPFDQIQHMPLTRDMSDSERTKIVAWIDSLNNS